MVLNSPAVHRFVARTQRRQLDRIEIALIFYDTLSGLFLKGKWPFRRLRAAVESSNVCQQKWIVAPSMKSYTRGHSFGQSGDN